MFECLFVRARNSKTIAPIDLNLIHEKVNTRGTVLLQDDTDPDRDMKNIIRHCEMGPIGHKPTKWRHWL